MTKTLTQSSDKLDSLESASNQSNSPLPRLLLTLVMLSIVLLVIVGGGLFFFSDFSRARWLWELPPFNAKFLGAIYLSALVGLANLVLAKRSSLARLIVPMTWVFTTVVLTVSCLQLQQFSVGRRATDIWFCLYLIDCVGSSYYLGYYRQQPIAGLRRLPRPWSIGLGIQAGILGAYGLGLFFMPETIGSWWPWDLDPFHAQLYSSIFLTGAIGAAILCYRATAVELKSLAAIQLTFSSFVLAGTWWVDNTEKRVDWGAWENWVWVSAIALLGLASLALFRKASQVKKSS